MKSRNIDGGGHLLTINDQHHDAPELLVSMGQYHSFMYSDVSLLLHCVSCISCVATYVCSLVLGKVSEKMRISDVMPSPGLGHHHYTQYTLLIYFTFPLFLFCWLSSKALKQCKEFEECPLQIIITRCQAQAS